LCRFSTVRAATSFARLPYRPVRDSSHTFLIDPARYHNRSHFNPAGYRAAADAILEFMRPRSVKSAGTREAAAHLQ